MKCPSCKGIGVITAGFHRIHIFCDICQGEGVLPDEMIYDPEKGKTMKKERIAREETLRRAAFRTGVDVIKISENERGFFREAK